MPHMFSCVGRQPTPDDQRGKDYQSGVDFAMQQGLQLGLSQRRKYAVPHAILLTILLFGAGGSGKTTMVKHSQLLFRGGFTNAQKSNYVPIIRQNIQAELVRICRAVLIANGMIVNALHFEETPQLLARMRCTAQSNALDTWLGGTLQLTEAENLRLPRLPTPAEMKRMTPQEIHERRRHVKLVWLALNHFAEMRSALEVRDLEAQYANYMKNRRRRDGAARPVGFCSPSYEGNEQWTINTPEYAHIVWELPVVQEMFRHRHRFEIQDSLDYFMKRMVRIAHPEYWPTEQDILRLRTRTTGIMRSEIDFVQLRLFYEYKYRATLMMMAQRHTNEIMRKPDFRLNTLHAVTSLAAYNHRREVDQVRITRGDEAALQKMGLGRPGFFGRVASKLINRNSRNLRLELVDVGGQRCERMKWMHVLQPDVSAVVFVASLNSYRELLAEDEGVNALYESLALFRDVVNMPAFDDCTTILFLNKFDVFFRSVTGYDWHELGVNLPLDEMIHKWPRDVVEKVPRGRSPNAVPLSVALQDYTDTDWCPAHSRSPVVDSEQLSQAVVQNNMLRDFRKLVEELEKRQTKRQRRQRRKHAEQHEHVFYPPHPLAI
ncbi:MAG: hypothetical protein MHM6MM_006518 [Cercozoa sp. M6MM]